MFLYGLLHFLYFFFFLHQVTILKTMHAYSTRLNLKDKTLNTAKVCLPFDQHELNPGEWFGRRLDYLLPCMLAWPTIRAYITPITRLALHCEETTSPLLLTYWYVGGNREHQEQNLLELNLAHYSVHYMWGPGASHYQWDWWFQSGSSPRHPSPMTCTLKQGTSDGLYPYSLSK